MSCMQHYLTHGLCHVQEASQAWKQQQGAAVA